MSDVSTPAAPAFQPSMPPDMVDGESAATVMTEEPGQPTQATPQLGTQAPPPAAPPPPASEEEPQTFADVDPRTEIYNRAKEDRGSEIRGDLQDTNDPMSQLRIDMMQAEAAGDTATLERLQANANHMLEHGVMPPPESQQPPPADSGVTIQRSEQAEGVVHLEPTARVEGLEGIPDVFTIRVNHENVWATKAELEAAGGDIPTLQMRKAAEFNLEESRQARREARDLLGQVRSGTPAADPNAQPTPATPPADEATEEALLAQARALKEKVFNGSEADAEEAFLELLQRGSATNVEDIRAIAAQTATSVVSSAAQRDERAEANAVWHESYGHLAQMAPEARVVEVREAMMALNPEATPVDIAHLVGGQLNKELGINQPPAPAPAPGGNPVATQLPADAVAERVASKRILPGPPRAAARQPAPPPPARKTGVDIVNEQRAARGQPPL